MSDTHCCTTYVCGFKLINFIIFKMDPLWCSSAGSVNKTRRLWILFPLVRIGYVYFFALVTTRHSAASSFQETQCLIIRWIEKNKVIPRFPLPSRPYAGYIFLYLVYKIQYLEYRHILCLMLLISLIIQNFS